MKKPAKKKQYRFELKEVYDDKTFKAEKIIFLDGKEVFKLEPLYLGKIRRDQTHEVMEHISKLLKKTVTKEDIKRALTFGYLEV